MIKTAKIFSNGRSQAVRLPASYRFDTKEVFVYKDEETGNVILSRKPINWDDFFKKFNSRDVPPDFLSEEERKQQNEKRNPLEGIME